MQELLQSEMYNERIYSSCRRLMGAASLRTVPVEEEAQSKLKKLIALDTSHGIIYLTYWD
jgi:hypothetical protein